MWASVVIGHKKPRENHLLWFYDTRRLCWRYSVQKITSTFLTELPRFQSKPLPSMLSANSAQRQLNLGTFSLRYLTACYPPIPPSKNGRYQRTSETNCFFKISCLVTVVVVYFELGHQRILSGKTKCQKTSSISLLRKTTTLHVYHAFFGTFLRRHYTTTTWHYLTWLFMEDVKKGRRIFFLFLNFSAVPKKSTPGKFAYIWQFQQIGINATKFEKTRIYFQIDVFTTLLVGDAKNKVEGWSFKIILGGCLSFTKSFCKIKRIENKWNTNFRVVSVENFREQRKVWFRVPFLQSHLWYQFQPFAAVFGNVTN